MAFLFNNTIFALLGALFTSIIGPWRLAPLLGLSARLYTLFLCLWAVPFAIGQFAQSDEWGSRWVQFQLLDLAYMPWATVFFVCCWAVVRWRKSYTEVDIRRWLRWSFGFAGLIAVSSELQDTWRAMRVVHNFWQANDWADWLALLIGTIATVVPKVVKLPALRRIRRLQPA